MPRPIPTAALPCALALLLLAGCGGPSGDCTGSVGSVPISGELGGETKLAIGGAPDSPRVAFMLLEYGDGAFFVETAIALPAERDATAINFGAEAPPNGFAGGNVTRFRITRPDDAPRVRVGVFTVRQVDAFQLEGDFDVTFEDDSKLRCTFDVSGSNRNPEDQLPDDGMFPTP